jgi:flagellar capping protein FliD
MRLTGLATGLDTDQMIQALGRVHTLRIDTVKRDRQSVVWRQEALRGVINTVTNFQRNNLNLASPMTNFRSASAFAKFSYSLSVGRSMNEEARNAASRVLSVTGTGDLRNFNQTVEKVSQLATKDTWSGENLGLKGITTDGFDSANFINYRMNENGDITFDGVSLPTFGVSIDGVSRTVQLSPSVISGSPNPTYSLANHAVVGDGTPYDLDNHFVNVGGKMVSLRDHITSQLNTTDPDGDDYVADVDAYLNALVDSDIQAIIGDQTVFSENPFVVDNNSLDNHYVLVNRKMVSLRDFITNESKGAVKFDGSAEDNERINEILEDVNIYSVSDSQENKQARAEAFAHALNQQIVVQFGKDYGGPEVGGNANTSIVTVNDRGELMFHKHASHINIFEAVPGMSTLSNLGLPPGGASTGNTANSKLTDVFDLPSEFFRQSSIENGETVWRTVSRTISINNKTITLTEDDTIQTLVNKVNSADAGVTLAYNSAGDRFTLMSNSEGQASNIQDITGAGAVLFAAMGFGTAVEVLTERLTVENGQPVTRYVPDFKLLVGDAPLSSILSNGDMVWARGYGNDEDPNADVLMTWNGTEFTHYAGKEEAFDDNGREIWIPQGSDGWPESLRYWNDDDGQWEYLDGTPVLDDDGNPMTEYPPADWIRGQTDVLATVGEEALRGHFGNVGNREVGQNLRATINGEEFVRQSNTFNHEGMIYTFTDTFNLDGTEEAIQIGVSTNTTELMDSIRQFVDEYNKVLTEINDLLSQKRDRDYRPLSDDERRAMSEDEVKAYEEKARAGIVANDQDLRRLQNQLRSAIYQKVEGVGLTMSDIGITTSPNFKDGGLLVINEDKLRNAIENNYDQVVSLFTKSSDIPYEDNARRGQRTSEVGIAHRLNDIMQDAVRTTRDSSNNKGYLVDKAGIQNDASAVQNSIQRQLDQYDKRISALLDRWYRQEQSYYMMFARMETAMMRMQSQQNSLAAILSGQQG